MTRKIMKLITMLAITFLVASSILAGTPKRGGTLVWSIGTTPRHLNPAVQSGIATGEPGAQLFATPLRFDENWNPQPYLAKSWEISNNGLSVTLNPVSYTHLTLPTNREV